MSMILEDLLSVDDVYLPSARVRPRKQDGDGPCLEKRRIHVSESNVGTAVNI